MAVKFYLHKPTSNSFNSTLVSKVDGVFLKYNISQFFAAGGGYNGKAAEVKNEIKKYGSVGISIQWGSTCGNYIWNKCPFIELVESRHEGEGDPVYNKFPVPYDPVYMEEVRKFLEYLAGQLYSVRDKIAYVKIMGINQQTWELRIPNQNFSTTTDMKLAYEIAVMQWKLLGYSNDLVRAAAAAVIQYHHTYFPNAVKVAALIGGTNGFPKMNDQGVFTLQPPVINDSILTALKLYPNMGVMATALTDEGGTPANMVNSGLPMYYQLNNNILNKSVAPEFFHNTIQNGIDNRGSVYEVYELNVKEHNSIIQEFRLAA